MLEANETQEQSLGLIFRYADQKGLPLLDLSDLRALLTFLDSDAGKAELAGIGGLASATVGVLLRALVGLEDGGGNEFFGEPQFEIADLLRVAPDGRGVISCLELPAVQDKPALFSTALMWMLAELFEELPEVGDLDKPKLVFFFDEAHLLFDGATEAFLDSVTQTVRLIRSKGVGVFFITQVPKDVPADVLGQLGNRVQHALRAFTPDDAKALKAAASTYPDVGVLRHRRPADADGHRRSRGDHPVVEGGADPRRAHAHAPAQLAHGAGRRRRCGREGVAAVGQVRPQGRRAERARDAGGAPAAAGRQRRQPRRRLRRRLPSRRPSTNRPARPSPGVRWSSGSSSTRGRARPSSAMSCAASSAC